MNQTQLQVDGMSCPSCVRHINEALCEIVGVQKVDVQLREGTVTVMHDAKAAPTSSLIDALRGAGYESRLEAA